MAKKLAFCCCPPPEPPPSGTGSLCTGCPLCEDQTLLLSWDTSDCPEIDMPIPPLENDGAFSDEVVCTWFNQELQSCEDLINVWVYINRCDLQSSIMRIQFDGLPETEVPLKSFSGTSSSTSSPVFLEFEDAKVQMEDCCAGSGTASGSGRFVHITDIIVTESGGTLCGS